MILLPPGAPIAKIGSNFSFSTSVGLIELKGLLLGEMVFFHLYKTIRIGFTNFYSEVTHFII